MAAKSGDLPFDEGLLDYFQCERGAYSPVTRTEAEDGQLTLTIGEKAIAVAHFGKEKLAGFRGSRRDLLDKGIDARLPFRKFPTGEIIYPVVNYPKPIGGELRLYFSNSGFKVSVGYFWGIFIKDGEIWLCEFSPWLFEDISRGLSPAMSASIALEGEDDDYQERINDAPRSVLSTGLLRWKRNPAVAANALKKGKFSCEVRPDLETFTSRKTGKPFLEAHHLIPMKAQSVFEKNLDVVENICILSPFVHRKLHHAPFDALVPDLQKLIAPRTNLLASLEIAEDYVFELYRRS